MTQAAIIGAFVAGSFAGYFQSVATIFYILDLDWRHELADAASTTLLGTSLCLAFKAGQRS